nr:Os03g0152500 [Ipomoea batatas]
MKQRQETQERVYRLPRRVLIRGHHLRRRDEIPVSQDYAFTQPRRPRRVQQRGCIALVYRNVVKIQRPGVLHQIGEIREAGKGAGNGIFFLTQNQNRQVEAFDFFQQLGNGDDELRATILDLFGKLWNCIHWIHGRGNGTGGDGAQEAEWEVDGVGGENKNDIVFPNTQLMLQAMSDFRDLGFQLCKSQGPAGVGVMDGRLVREGAHPITSFRLLVISKLEDQTYHPLDIVGYSLKLHPKKRVRNKKSASKTTTHQEIGNQEQVGVEVGDGPQADEIQVTQSMVDDRTQLDEFITIPSQKKGNSLTSLGVGISWGSPT